jgi:DNA-binding Xre family transcriptional regulator
MDFVQRVEGICTYLCIVLTIKASYPIMKNIFTRQEIADIIGIHKRTLERRIKAANLELPRHLLTLRHLFRICEALNISTNDIQKKIVR